MRDQSSSLTLVGLLIAAFCLSGCYTVTYSASQAQPIPDISKLTREYRPDDGYPLRLKLSDLEVDVKALNRASPYFPPSRTGSKLLVLLTLSPKAADVRFDPLRVRYQPEGEQPDRPSLVVGPGLKKGRGGRRFKSCFPSAKYRATYYAPITGAVAVTERACFRIFFDDDRTEERAFTLFIEGISKSGKPVAVPPVDFRLKTWTKRRVGSIMIGLVQVSQAWTALQPTPQETHFRVVQKFCKKQAQKSGDAERAYVGCMTEFTEGKKFL